MYYVRKLKVGKSDLLDQLALECGKLYTQNLVCFWRVVRKKNIWLKPSSMMRWHSSDKLHAHTADAVVQSFFSAMSGWREARKFNHKLKPPYKLKKFFKIQWKKSAIRVKNGMLALSNGKKTPALILPWSFELPTIVEIGWDGKQYELRAVYTNDVVAQPIGNEVAGLDLGEIHLAVTYDGVNCHIVNGRELRSKRQYQNKIKATIQSKIDHKKKGSRRFKKLVRSKRKQLNRLDHQIKDISHKQTTKLIHTLHSEGVKIVVIGDLRNLRQNVDVGHKNNQKIHQMLSGQTRHMVEYKAAKRGVKTELIDESYTSQTCPVCGHRYKPKGRNYVCRKCGFIYHRDGVGSINIRGKYLGVSQVVGVMASPIGVRYKPHMRCSSERNLKYVSL